MLMQMAAQLALLTLANLLFMVRVSSCPADTHLILSGERKGKQWQTSNHSQRFLLLMCAYPNFLRNNNFVLNSNDPFSDSDDKALLKFTKEVSRVSLA